MPFSRGIFIAGDPITVDRGSTDEEVELLRVKVEEALNKITDEADGSFT